MKIGAAVRIACIGVFAAALAGCAQQTARTASTGIEKIQHILVIYAENRSFDHLYGLFPGANGIANASAEQYTQVDNDGKALPYVAPVDHTQYDTTSIIKFITRRFGVEPLPGVRPQMGDLTAAFDFSQ